MAIDVDGLIQGTDKIGGVDVDVAVTPAWPYTFVAGINHSTVSRPAGASPQCKTRVGGDFDRVHRQQQYLQTMLTKLSSSSTVTDPVKLESTRSWGNGDLLDLANSMRSVRLAGRRLSYRTGARPGRESPASVVYLDAVVGVRMWTYLRNDSPEQNAGEFTEQTLPDVPR